MNVKMGEFNINGIKLKFPYDSPYDVQITFMENVIQSLKNKQTALLESPTGTGKTFCLLCPTLAYIEHLKDQQSKAISELLSGINFDEIEEFDEQEQDEPTTVPLDNEITPIISIPKVIFASRTHTQVKQAMEELRRSEYKNMNCAVIGSREQLCKNPQLDGLTNDQKTSKCRTLRKNDECPYYLNLQMSLHEPDFQTGIKDIEDLCNAQQKFQCCAFYASKERIKNAEIIFMPYNYILDAKIRKFNKINLKNTIIILDEAHNVSKTCQECASFTISSMDINSAISDTKYIQKYMDKSKPVGDGNWANSFSLNDLDRMISSLGSFYNEIQNYEIQSKKLSGGFIFPILEKAGITVENSNWYTVLTGKLITHLREKSDDGQNCPDGKGLSQLEQLFQTISMRSPENVVFKVDQCFRIQIEHDSNHPKLLGAKILKFLCLSPAFGLSSLFEEGIHNLIMTSGTLSPLEALAMEMEIDNPILLSNGHIIKPSQIFVRVLECGRDEKILFDSTYKNRENEDYLRSLGNSIIEICGRVPGGLLIFFQSYTVKDLCTNFWKRENIWRKIERFKPICEESNNKKEFDQQKKMYYEYISKGDKTGAIFMAVLRGKVSEGVDFANMYGRAVIIVGIPFLANTLELDFKRNYLNDKKKIDDKMISFQEWYEQDAARAVNQAIGRVIRHINDYGAILFCDHRFRCGKNQKYISNWVKMQLNNQSNKFNTILEDLKYFYLECEMMLPEPKLKSDAMENRNDDNEYVPCKNANCDPYYPTNESDSDDGQIEQTEECTLTAPEALITELHEPTQNLINCKRQITSKEELCDNDESRPMKRIKTVIFKKQSIESDDE